MSDQEHFVKSHHNPAYDHEAFLGEEAKTFDQLTPEESTRRLGVIVDKIDKDTDGFVTKEELKDWIKFTQQRYLRDDTERQWRNHNPSEKDKITWEEYRNVTYGFIDEDDPKFAETNSENYSYLTMQNRDRRRWSVADQDGDDALTLEEFKGFLHPEETDHMSDIVVIETLEDIDTDGDGKISLAEYIGDMYNAKEGEEPPEWVKNEQEQFATHRDKDGDGFLNKEEVNYMFDFLKNSCFRHLQAILKYIGAYLSTFSDYRKFFSDFNYYVIFQAAKIYCNFYSYSSKTNSDTRQINDVVNILSQFNFLRIGN